MPVGFVFTALLLLLGGIAPATDPAEAPPSAQDPLRTVDADATPIYGALEAPRGPTLGTSAPPALRRRPVTTDLLPLLETSSASERADRSVGARAPETLPYYPTPPPAQA